MPLRLIIAIALAAGVPLQAGLVIVPDFGSSITSDPNAANIEAAINAAIGIYEGAFTDPITVAIQFNEITSGLGASVFASHFIPYSTFYAAYLADAKTNNDALALANDVPNGSNNPVTGSGNILIKTANGRALGIPGSDPVFAGGLDGFIGLNTSITTPGTGAGGPFDLQVTAEHEIDEILGLGSALDFSTTDLRPEDLFRWMAPGVRSFSTASGTNPYLSIDGGVTNLAPFNVAASGSDNGDFAPSVTVHVQDAFGTPNAHPALGVELTALDVIGYDLAAPEPGTLASFAAGLAAVLMMRRRSRPWTVSVVVGQVIVDEAAAGQGADSRALASACRLRSRPTCRGNAGDARDAGRSGRNRIHGRRRPDTPADIPVAPRC